MSDGPSKIVPKAEPLDEMILGEDELHTAPAPAVQPRPSQPPPLRSKPPPSPSPSAAPPYFPPPASNAPPVTSKRSSQRVKAADAVEGGDRDSQSRKRAKVTLRIPDDEVARPSDEVTIPLVRTMTGPPPPNPPSATPQAPVVAFNPDDTLEMPADELRARSAAALINDPAPVQPMLAAPVAPGVDAGTEKGWTPQQPHVTNDGPIIQPTPIFEVRGSMSSPPIPPAPAKDPHDIHVALPSSEEIPVAVDLGLASDSSDDVATSPRLPMDSEEIKIDETGERPSLTETGELEINADDMLSVDSLPPTKSLGKFAPYKTDVPVQQQSASQMMANAPIASQPPPPPAVTPSTPAILNAPQATPSRPASSTPSQPAVAASEPVREPQMAARRQSSPSFPSVGGLAPPPMTDSAAANRKKTRPWWEELFNDDFIRTMAKITDGQINAEATFIEESLGCESGAMVLDLACGTGRHAVELASRGYQVVGFDLSLAMLARASDEAQDRKQKINFVQGDMREMTFEETFDGVYSWNTSFGFFDEMQNSAVIARVHKSLKKGGQFLLDVVNRDYIIRHAPSLAWFEGDGCICMDEMTIDFITSRMKVKRTLMMDDGRTKEIEYSIRVYSLHELGKMLHDNGFRVAEVSGRTATPGVFFGCEAPRTLILAEKR